MPRSLWTGSLSFGLVNVPVAMFSGVSDQDLHFRQLHAKDHTPVETHRYCAEEDEEVPYDEIASGYETGDGELVILTDAELAAAAPRRSRTIDIEAFVDLDEVDPIHFAHPYVLMPSGEAEGIQRAYRLLVDEVADHGTLAVLLGSGAAIVLSAIFVSVRSRQYRRRGERAGTGGAFAH